MIPIEITLKNFLSYGPEPQTIDFRNHHLICLTGKNGHGKSALLDAITWALWGNARKIAAQSKADSGLLRLGASEMLVMIDFITQGQTYRIKREYVQTKHKSQQLLECGIIDPETHTIRPLTDKTIRATQAVIDKIVGLSYETFINSAFIRQGSSNEFSTKSPKERKEIVCAILGIDQFEKTKKLILEEQREHTIRIAHLERSRDLLMHDSAKEHLLKEEQQKMLKATMELSQQELKLFEQKQRITTKKTELQEQHQSLKLVDYEKKHTQERISAYKNQLSELIQKWRHVHQMSLGRKKIKTLESRKLELQEIVRALLIQQENCLRSKEELLKTKEELYSLGQEHELVFQKQRGEYQLSLNQISLELNSCKKTEAALELQKATQAKQKEFLEIETRDIESDLTTCMQTLERKMPIYTRLQERFSYLAKQLEKATAIGVISSNSCPTCMQPIEEEKKQSLIDRKIKEESLRKHQLKRLQKVLPLAETHIASLKKKHGELLKKQELLQLLSSLKRELIITAEQLVTTQKIKADLEQDYKISGERLTSLATHYATWTTHSTRYQELNTKRELLETLIKEQTVETSKITDFQKELHTIENELVQFSNLEEEIRNQSQTREAITNLCKELRALKHVEQQHLKTLLYLPTIVTALHEITETEKNIYCDEQNLNASKELLAQRQGQLKEQDEQLKRAQREIKNIEEELKAAHTLLLDCQALAGAFSKDGIQALLIEEALPEIEEEANSLLAKLTDNTQQLFLESLRDLKTGGLRETLDIKISDTMGIRPYELFSGGEAFRIDFALRIALSKLLARRAGTALQTLIIDEGFGSQDDEGLSRVMDALHCIQDDFEKIIIVSHLPSMQNQFPTQFYVAKGASGSKIQVILQG